MKIFREYSQSQGLLLPPLMDEFVPEDHEARIINNVVDSMDLSPLLAKYEGGGAPAYHPAMMLKAIIYAYSRDIYSSRSIAQELKTDTVFMSLINTWGKAKLRYSSFRTGVSIRQVTGDVKIAEVTSSSVALVFGHFPLKIGFLFSTKAFIASL